MNRNALNSVLAGLLLAAFAVPAFGLWQGWTHEDPMDDSVRKGVWSSWMSPLNRMGFPYHETKARLSLLCDDGPRTAYMDFTNVPILSGAENHDGFETMNLRVRFDNGEVRRVRAIQPWGSNMVGLDTTNHLGKLRDAILGGNTMLVEIPWHGEGNVIFDFSLAGSRKAFDAECGPGPDR